MVAHRLTVRWPGGATSLGPGRMATIGRGADCDIVLDSLAVSRRHAQLIGGSTGWVLTDLGSSTGTFAAGRRVNVVPVGTGVEVVLGAGADSVPVSLVPADPDDSGPSTAPHAPLTVQHREGPTGWVPVVPAEPPPAARPDSGPESHPTHLTVDVAGTSRLLGPGEALTLGRHPDNDVVLTQPTVSRHHARVASAEGGGWTLEDVGSTAGTWLEGTRLESSVQLRGSQVFLLGDRVSGVRLRTTTPAG